MQKIRLFGQTRNVAVTALIDNRADLIVKSTDTIKYFTDKPLLAEHGFSALIHLKDDDIRILWDAGLTSTAFMENARRMGVDLAAINKIAISHGHRDHTAAVTDVLRSVDVRPKAKEWKPGTSAKELQHWAEGRRVPVIAHPAAFRERWGMKEDGTKSGPHLPPPRAEWEAVGAQIILSDGPYELGPGCWTTGLVPRRSFEQSGRSLSLRYRDGESFLRDDIEEDQAAVLSVKDKGLVIVSGCAHSGIVNTVDHAREISGVDKVWAILGGFHLARAEDWEIQRTIDEIRRHNPVLIVPSHCTGFKAMAQFAAQMPDAFAPGVVGATYLF